jgi:formaldehyde-activating enzyme involved in methanogenesis
MALDLSTLSAEQQLAAIYIGYYDRAADPVGQDFWEGAVSNPNLSLADIATDFATQPETLIAYPFLDNPTAEEAEGFIAEVYLNLFNRAPDAAGLEFWSGALLSAIAGDEGALSVGEIILAIIGGAQNSEDGQDLQTILNKIEVSTSWTSAAEAAGIDYASDSAAQNSAKSIIEGVTDEGSSVTAAKATIDGFFEPQPVPGNTYFLTSGTDRGEDFTGTSDDDEFLAYIEQNPFAGGVSNSLSSADHLDGGAGNDRLYAELTSEFVGVTNSVFNPNTDVQPRSKNIEEIDIEARDNGSSFFGGYYGDSADIIVDAKNITDHVEIGSYYSDGDLTIENLTTLTSSGTARNTSEITITMDHTDNFNSDEDASDLVVYFDNDYLLSGQEAQGQIFYFLLDEDAELANNPNRLNNIDVDGIRFTIEGVDVTLEAAEANVAGTHQGFVNALQPALQALIADGTLPAGTTLTLDPTIIDTTFLDDGSESDDIPAIVLTSGDGSEVIATGFSRIEEEIGEYDVYGRFNSVNEIEDQPVSVDIDLHKVGRGGDGGDLIVGGKASRDTADGIEAGIEVFNINVLGAGNDDPNGMMTKPSSLGTIQSTFGVLDVVNIATDPVYAAGDTYASLEVRNGFDGDTSLINADAFLGDLMLFNVRNSDTITAQGGGDVTLGLNYNGNETDTAYSVTTAGGDDSITVDIDGDALDYAGSSLNVSTGAGDDDITMDRNINPDVVATSNEQLNQAILDNIMVDGGSGDDVIDVDGLGNSYILGGEGDDVIYTDGDGSSAAWAFNFDAARATSIAGIAGEELPGVQTSLAYIGGATVTVTLSGAGGSGIAAQGGGVMSDGIVGAVIGDDGYESSVEINSLLNGNDFYGDQRDINAAVMEAINDDPILSNLLTVTMGANNTLVITSDTSGRFDADDLRIDIEQADLDDWDDVEAEAQALASDSGLTIGDLDEANTNFGNDLRTSADADEWYDGLSNVDSTDNSTTLGTSNQSVAGSASDDETDNVINGGNDDDLIVLSTDAVGWNAFEQPFSVSSNNALINGASNETVVMTGDFFGNDTVMNFEDGDVSEVTGVEGQTFTFLGTSYAPNAGYEQTVITVTGIAVNDEAIGPVTFTFEGTTTVAEIATGLAAAVNEAAGFEIASSAAGVLTLQSPAITSADLTDASITVTDVDLDGTNAPQDFPAAGLVTIAPATAADFLVGSGLDFLDFTAYLTSTESPSGSSTSEQFINVTLDNQTDVTSPGDVIDANEVVVVTYDDNAAEDGTFANLSASDIEALFDGDDFDIDGLEATWDVSNNETDDDVVGGDAKAIVMVENGANDGEYKVFELSWDASEDDGDEGVSASLIGSLDFGDSLTDLANVNLVGSEAYNLLLQDGFFPAP